MARDPLVDILLNRAKQEERDLEEAEKEEDKEIKDINKIDKLNRLLGKSSDPEVKNRASQLIQRLKGGLQEPQGSAAEELIERLRQPKEGSEFADLSPLIPFASKEYQTALLEGAKESFLSEEEERLAKAVDIEQRQRVLDLKKAGQNSEAKRLDKDLDAINKYGRILIGAERGATNFRKQRQRVNTINRARTMFEDIENGLVTFDEVSNTDYSALFSGLITGRAPGIEMIKASKYKYIGGDLNQWASYISGNPKSDVSKAMMGEIKNMIFGLERSIKHDYGKEQAKLFNVYKSRLDRNPAEKERYMRMISPWVNFNEFGEAIEKRFDDPFAYKDVSYQGKELTDEEIISQAMKRNPGASKEEVIQALKDGGII
jgi:hypothetical protein